MPLVLSMESEQGLGESDADLGRLVGVLFWQQDVKEEAPVGIGRASRADDERPATHAHLY
jgi:hypothetical protein